MELLNITQPTSILQLSILFDGEGLRAFSVLFALGPPQSSTIDSSLNPQHSEIDRLSKGSSTKDALSSKTLKIIHIDAFFLEGMGWGGVG